MDIIKQLENRANAFLSDTLFLVGVEQKAGSGKISVFIDGDGGVTIEDCRLLARDLNQMLDELDYGETPYYLEVSSPGVDRPLVSNRQYKKHIGRELLIKFKSHAELLGKLDDVNEKGIRLLLKDKKKGYKEAAEKEVLFDEIAEAMVQISFNK